MLLEVTDIQQGCTHDGPGLRTTVFLKGCPLHCRWCHNPETQSTGKEFYYRPEKCIGCMSCAAACPMGCHREENSSHLFDPASCVFCMSCAQVCPADALEPVSKRMPLEEVLQLVDADRVFYRKRGGLTVSGGEPTVQREGLLALLDGARERNISTCLETCGAFPATLIPELLSRVDLFLYDIKDTDPARLKANTGGDLTQILRNLTQIDSLGGETVLRCILIPEVNLESSHAHALAQLYQKLSHCRYIELLPYHPYGLSKSQQLGKEGTRYRQPEQAELEGFASILTKQGIPVKLHGSML